MFNHLGEGDDGVEPDWDEMIISVMGDEDSYGYAPYPHMARSHSPLITVDEALSYEAGTWSDEEHKVTTLQHNRAQQQPMSLRPRADTSPST